jgi:transcriptional regulator with XRE-family HTH domain
MAILGGRWAFVGIPPVNVPTSTRATTVVVQRPCKVVAVPGKKRILLSTISDQICSLNISMPHAPLTTYLRMYRRQTGLVQDDVAYLLGVVTGATVSRHESAERIPLLETALAYEVILGVAASELYEGELRRVEKGIRLRARGLRLRLERRPKCPELVRRIAYVRLIEETRISRAKKLNTRHA